MTLTSRIRHVLDPLKCPSKTDLKKALLQLDLKLDDLAGLPEPSVGKPYNRKLLYKNEEVEMLVMNWSQLECAPHDHGNSHGWIQVLSGTSLNSVYEVKGNGLPFELFHEFHHKGKHFYAPKKAIHKMQASNKTNLVTLHLYSPPITGMIVYDLQKCAACVVSDDCGAWWPDEQYQKVKEIQLKKDAVPDK
ncbi:cysteine dioxygenase family protein [Paenibacillus sp. BSR1-1]|uniref:cysteine dioxygenase n=1 Tax=Paenibacillus sp. BSR1-1 TaxID=3020845 RepID=UPI0025B1E8AD|nr:cysteine dioxygenase family protein [Paenibacillus sp. BSR1-1]MDN3016886.1 cysteine dioxygenase family protein [Paenibacillus sp. BSR1-1]